MHLAEARHKQHHADARMHLAEARHKQHHVRVCRCTHASSRGTPQTAPCTCMQHEVCCTSLADSALHCQVQGTAQPNPRCAGGCARLLVAPQAFGCVMFPITPVVYRGWLGARQRCWCSPSAMRIQRDRWFSHCQSTTWVGGTCITQ